MTAVLNALFSLVYYNFRQSYYSLRQLYYLNPIYYYYAFCIEESYNVRHPFRYTVNEYRLNKIEYFQRKKRGYKITFKELEDTYWKNKMDNVAESLRNFHESKKGNTSYNYEK